MHLLRLGLTLGCLYALWDYWLTRPNWPENQIINPLLLGIALGLTPVLLAFRALKWRACLVSLSPEITHWQALRSYLGALRLGILTPGRACEFTRGLYLPYASVQGIQGSGRVILDNWTDSVSVLVFALPGAFWLWGWKGLTLGGIVLITAAAIPLWLKLVHSLIQKGERFTGWKKRVLGFLQAFIPTGESISSRSLFVIFGYGLMAYVVEGLQFILLLRGLGESQGQSLILAGLLALVHLANSVQVTVAGIGPREGLTTWLLAKAGLSASLVLGASFFQTALVLFLPAGIGLFFKPYIFDKDSGEDLALTKFLPRR